MQYLNQNQCFFQFYQSLFVSPNLPEIFLQSLMEPHSKATDWVTDDGAVIVVVVVAAVVDGVDGGHDGEGEQEHQADHQHRRKVG